MKFSITQQAPISYSMHSKDAQSIAVMTGLWNNWKQQSGTEHTPVQMYRKPQLHARKKLWNG